MSNQSPDNRVGQVQVIPFKIYDGLDPQVLLLKRNEDKGGFWQPVTGGINPGESVEVAALRETEEETGATPEDLLKIINDEYSFEFTDKHRGVMKTFTEYVVAIVLRCDFEPVMSDEHDETRVVSIPIAMTMLKYDSNKKALGHYAGLVNSEASNGNTAA